MVMKKMVDGVVMDMTPEEEAEALLQQQLFNEEQARTEYIRKRLWGEPNYGSIESQLDMMYHLGFEGWREHIRSVKEAHPKPEEEGK